MLVGWLSTECDLEVRSFENVCDVRSFLPTYLKLTHVCVVWLVICLSGLGVGVLCGFIGKELCRMLCIMFSSCWYSFCGESR